MDFDSTARYWSGRDVGSLTQRDATPVSILAAFAPVGSTTSRATGYVYVIDGSNITQ
jgi:hypothetical protein